MHGYNIKKETTQGSLFSIREVSLSIKEYTMATRIRITRVGATYHVTVRCNNKEHLIDPETFSPMYKRVLQLAKEKYEVEVHNYTIMTNHVHLVLMTNLDNISRFMQYVNSQSARRYNRMIDRSGHFWGERFFSEIIETDEHLFNTMVYIDLNMWRAGGVDDPKDWKYGSYNVYAYGKKDSVTDLIPFYLEIPADKRQEWYRAIVADRKHTIQREHVYVKK